MRPPGTTDDEPSQVRQLNPAHCYELNPLKHGGARRLGALGWSGPSRGVDREETFADLAQCD
jgi:hypothetical protein